MEEDDRCLIESSSTYQQVEVERCVGDFCQLGRSGENVLTSTGKKERRTRQPCYQGEVHKSTSMICCINFFFNSLVTIPTT